MKKKIFGAKLKQSYIKTINFDDVTIENIKKKNPN